MSQLQLHQSRYSVQLRLHVPSGAWVCQCLCHLFHKKSISKICKLLSVVTPNVKKKQAANTKNRVSQKRGFLFLTHSRPSERTLFENNFLTTPTPHFFASKNQYSPKICHKMGCRMAQNRSSVTQLRNFHRNMAYEPHFYGIRTPTFYAT